MWTDERVETLKTLWDGGLSAGKIASRLGAVSKNSVIGKAHRLGLRRRKASTKPTRKQSRLGALMTISKARQVRPSIAKAGGIKPRVNKNIHREGSALPAADPTDVARVTLDELEPHHCRWPVGTPAHGFCGCQRAHGPYCEDHARRAYENQTPAEA